MPWLILEIGYISLCGAGLMSLAFYIRPEKID